MIKRKSLLSAFAAVAFIGVTAFAGASLLQNINKETAIDLHKIETAVRGKDTGLSWVYQKQFSKCKHLQAQGGKDVFTCMEEKRQKWMFGVLIGGIALLEGIALPLLYYRFNSRFRQQNNKNSKKL